MADADAGNPSAAVTAALRAAAEQHGEPLSVARYDAGGHQPSSSRIIQRFGSWNAACAAAGLRTRQPSRSYARSWDPALVTAAVARYLTSPGATGSYADYAQWARTADGAPSAQTVRNVLGSWAQAKVSAARR